MKSSKCLLLIAVLAFVTSQTVEAKGSRSRSNDSGRRGNGRNGHNRNNSGRSNRNEGFKCPEMACPPINPTCRDVEYLILQFSEVDSNSDRIFECRGCDYCIDFRILQKRAVKRHHNARRLLRFECPGVSDHCEDVRMVNVYLPTVRDQSWLCKACFDHVHQNT